jgi:hypothetical protein
VGDPVKLYAVIALTVVMYAAYVVCDRVLRRIRKARREMFDRRTWWETPTREVEQEGENESDETVYGV